GWSELDRRAGHRDDDLALLLLAAWFYQLRPIQRSRSESTSAGGYGGLQGPGSLRWLLARRGAVSVRRIVELAARIWIAGRVRAGFFADQRQYRHVGRHHRKSPGVCRRSAPPRPRRISVFLCARPGRALGRLRGHPRRLRNAPI